jgi:hypothetical protein
MRFKQFINESDFHVLGAGMSDKPVIAPIPIGPFREWCKRHASHYITNVLSADNYIVRGVPSDTQYAVGNSAMFKRKSANTKNFVNSFIATSPRWKNYPSRESAYICADNLHTAAKYSSRYDPFLVIPADNAHIGICPRDDFWPSFERGLAHADLWNINDVADLNTFLTTTAETLNVHLPETDSEKLHDVLRSWTKDVMKKVYHTAVVDAMNNLDVDNMDDLLEIVLGPELNKFSQTTASNYHKRTGDREVWVAGRAAFIKVDGHNIEKIIRTLKDAV